MDRDMTGKHYAAVLSADTPLTAGERAALQAALAAIAGADPGPLTDAEAMGLTLRELALTVTVSWLTSISANFATDAIKAAIAEAELTDKITVEEVMPIPAPRPAPPIPKPAPNRD